MEVQVAKTHLTLLLVHIMHMVLFMQISSRSKHLISSLMGTAIVDRMRQSNTVSAWVLVSWPWQQRMKRSMSNLRTPFTSNTGKAYSKLYHVKRMVSGVLIYFPVSFLIPKKLLKLPKKGTDTPSLKRSEKMPSFN